MSQTISRRSLLRNLCGTAAAGIVVPQLCASRSVPVQEQEHNGSRAAMARIGRAFMEKYSVPGMSVSISRNGKFVYEHQWGMADKKDAQLVEPRSLFRIASVTKPITSVTIFTLIEKGRLNLNDKVFGPSGVLGTKYGKAPYRQYVTDVTVDHLLTHTSGGWPNDSTDPMFRFDSWDHAKLISWTVANFPLTNPPGQQLGLLQLRILRAGPRDRAGHRPAVRGLRPSEYSRSARNQRYARRREQTGSTRAERSGVLRAVQRDPYKMNVTRMDSHGGWLATPSDLVIFLDHVAGAPNIPSLLKPETIKIMTTPSPAYPPSSPGKYARGWMVRNNGAANWWHNGSLPGSTTIMVRTSTGLCWAALTNTRTEPSDEINGALDQMMWDMVHQVPSWAA